MLKSNPLTVRQKNGARAFSVPLMAVASSRRSRARRCSLLSFVRDASLGGNSKGVATSACAPRDDAGRRRQGKPQNGLRPRTAGGHQSPDAKAAEDDGGNSSQEKQDGSSPGRVRNRSAGGGCRNGSCLERPSSIRRAAPMSVKRSFRGFFKHRCSVCRTHAGTSPGSASNAGSRCRICESVSETSSPSNARRPVSIS